jgi:hypothetical protein
MKASAAIRKDLKELETLKAELNEIHLQEEKKAIKELRSVGGTLCRRAQERPQGLTGSVD